MAALPKLVNGDKCFSLKVFIKGDHHIGTVPRTPARMAHLAANSSYEL